ncbi:MAG: ABC transporter ATP-binding protein [Oscillospiraceae bacterium]
MKTLKRLLKYIKQFKLSLILATVFAFLGVFLSLLVPILIGKSVDNIIGINDVNFSMLFKVLITLSTVIVLSAFFQWLMSLLINSLSYKTVEKLRSDTFSKLTKVSLKSIDEIPHGDIISTVINDIEIVSTGLLQGFTQTFTSIMTIIGTIALMFSINQYLALSVIILTPLSLFMSSFIAKKTHKKYTQQAKLRGNLTSLSSEMIDGAFVVSAFNKGNDELERFKIINNDLEKVGIKAHFYSALSNPCTRFVNSIVYAVVGILGSIFAVSGIITVGAIASALAYCSQYTKPFNEISSVITEFQNALSSAKRIFDFLDLPEQTPDKGLYGIKSIKGNIKISNLEFSYSNQKFIKDLNLDIKSGQTVAIVGPTGCGKTTLINLLMRFYECDGGKIKIDDYDITEITRTSLRRKFGMVLQDSWLFSGTIYDNIAYGNTNANYESVINAAKNARAHSFIKKLPNGYNTIISENSDNLSEGQKQLLCIARVMLTNPPMLILDEATSNIDTRTEIKIQKSLLELMQGKTAFIVAHRLSTIKNADIILVMKDGQIIEKGSHNELLEKENGFYKQLYYSQFDEE